MPTTEDLGRHVSGAGTGTASSSSSSSLSSGIPPSVQDANNLIYQAIRDHKQKEMEKQLSVLRDNHSITETMIRKRKEADENKSVVTASSFYANNAQYVLINSGKDPRIILSPSMHPLNPDECDVYTSLVEAAENSTICASLNHHINDTGEIEGFRFTCSAGDMANCLPISRRMFFLHSMVECDIRGEDCSAKGQPSVEQEAADLVEPGSEPGKMGRYVSLMQDYNSSLEDSNKDLEAGSVKRKAKIGLATAAIMSSNSSNHPQSVPRNVSHNNHESTTILNLLLNRKEVCERLVRLVQTIYKESVGNEVNFSCMPDNADILQKAQESAARVDPMTLFGTVHNRRAADCKNWKPEMPETVGIYHAYVRGFNKDTRSHKLFIVTSGGCTSMADSYFNLFVDVRNHMRVSDVVNSEEPWFLRNACKRNNSRILLARLT